MKKPSFIVIPIDDLCYDEFGAGGHPYMKTLHIDRIANEGVLFERAFHIAPTPIELAGGKPGPQVQGRSLVPLFGKSKNKNQKRKRWRKSFLVEYWAEQAMPWLVGMAYKAVRTDRHKLIHRGPRFRGARLRCRNQRDAKPKTRVSFAVWPLSCRGRITFCTPFLHGHVWTSM